MMTQRRRSGKLRPIHSPSSETVNEQLRRAESLPTDTREYMKDIHSVEGERGEGARVTARGRIYYPLCNYIYYPLCYCNHVDRCGGSYDANFHYVEQGKEEGA